MKDRDSNILCYIHLCYFLDYKENFELTTLYHDMNKLRDLIKKENIEYMIIYEKDFDFILLDILDEFEIEKEYHDYKILKRIRIQSII